MPWHSLGRSYRHQLSEQTVLRLFIRNLWYASSDTTQITYCTHLYIVGGAQISDHQIEEFYCFIYVVEFEPGNNFGNDWMTGAPTINALLGINFILADDISQSL